MTLRRPRAPTLRQLAILKLYTELTRAQGGTPPTSNQLADHLGITRSGAYQHIRTLEAKGYLAKTLGPRGPLYSPSTTARTPLGHVELTRTPESSGYRLHAQLGDHHAEAFVHHDPERFGTHQRRASARLIATVVERALLELEEVDLPVDGEPLSARTVVSLEIAALRPF